MTETNTISVLIVDDQPLIRSGLKMILATSENFHVVGEAVHGLEAIAMVELHRPAIVIMDIQMPVLDGVEAARRIALMANPPKILMLTTFERDDYLHEALRVGASGFLLKTSPPERLLDALTIVAKGDSLVDPVMTRRLIDSIGKRLPNTNTDVINSLTDRERDVLQLVAKGYSNAEIAKTLVIGETTVKTHVSSVLLKLSLRDRVQAVVFAYENGVATPGSD
jgi:DNA-binding NarL/FixJ family response regulator